MIFIRRYSNQRDQRRLYWALLREGREEYNIRNDETSQIISFINRFFFIPAGPIVLKTGKVWTFISLESDPGTCIMEI
jgi:DNA-binding MarR family transcriptional regulator